MRCTKNGVSMTARELLKILKNDAYWNRSLLKWTKCIKTRKLQLIIEKDKNKLWGSVLVHNNLIVDTATSLEALEKKLRKLILYFEKLDQIKFEYAYDLTVFFERYSYLNQTKIAEMARLNPSLVRQYSSGHKFPSKEQVKKIEEAVHEISHELKTVRLSSRQVKRAV